MPTPADKDFLAGVIEGFYGAPWTRAERFALFDWMVAWKLNTYLYAPKDDLKHRARVARDLFGGGSRSARRIDPGLRGARPALHLCAESGTGHSLQPGGGAGVPAGAL